jgi:hypothetical protein
MTSGNDEQLEAIRQELERQNREWERIKEQLAALGDVELQVPHHVLEQVVDSTPACSTHAPAAPVLGVRA